MVNLIVLDADGHKVGRRITSGEEYKAIRNTDSNKQNFAAARAGNNNAKRTTASTYELTPFFSETADGLVLSDDIFAVRSGPTGPKGLYELAGKQFYFGYYLALKDGG